MRATRRGAVANSVLVAALGGGMFALGCGTPEGAGPSSANDQFSSVSLELTTVPSSAQCIRITATPSSGSATVKLFTVTAGSTSANLQLGVLAPGSYVFSADAFNVACASISGAGNWIADSVTATVRPGVTSNITMTFRKNNPVAVNANFVNNVQGMAVNFLNTIIATDSGIVQAGNINPALGVGSNSVFLRPNYSPFDSSTVPGNAPVAVATTDNGACAIRVDGTVWCWGGSLYGEMGPAVAVGAYADTPVQVTGLSGAKLIAAGRYHVCAATSVGVYCWGYNGYGQLGNNTTTNSATPVLIYGLTARSLSAGFNSTYVVAGDGTLYACGYNAYGQLGDGTTTNRLTLTWSDGGIQMVAAGGYHACSLGADGTARCWGYNGLGQLGNGTTTSMYSSPHPIVANLGAAKQIVAGISHSCALNAAGQTLCWGEGILGELGNGTTGNSLTPALVTLPVPLTSLYSGPYAPTTCGIATSLDVYCWGSNAYGALGDGTRNNAFLPMRIQMQ